MTSTQHAPPTVQVQHPPTNSMAVSILACGGGLPLEIAKILKRDGRSVNVVCIAGMADADYTGFKLTTVSIGRIGALLKALKAGGIHDMLIAGHARRPDLRSLNIDLGFVRHFPTILGLMRGGDDHVLRKIAAFFERNGLNVKSIEEFAPDLLTPCGDFAGTGLAPAALRESAAYGLQTIHSLGPFDVGQAVILENGRIAAIEGAEGTNRLIARQAENRHEHPNTAKQSRVLVKAAKPGQDLRVDLPTIGVETIEKCAAAGIQTIALEAGRSLIVARSETLASALKHGISLISLKTPSAHPHQSPTAAQRPATKNRATAPASLTSLARVSAPPKAMRDALKGLRLLAACPANLEVQAAVVGRENILAINVGEPMQSFIERSERLVQWGDRREGGKRNRVLAVITPATISPETWATLSGSKIGGFAILTTAGSHDELDEIIELATAKQYFVLSAP